MSERLPHPLDPDAHCECTACGHQGVHDCNDVPAFCPACGSVLYDEVLDDDDRDWEGDGEAAADDGEAEVRQAASA